MPFAFSRTSMRLWSRATMLALARLRRFGLPQVMQLGVTDETTYALLAEPDGEPLAVVSVDHPNGLRTTYEPVAPAVKAGARVAAGAVLGHLRPGHAGCPGACLHWGVRRGEEYLDPLALVSTGRVRLLPWKEVG